VASHWNIFSIGRRKRSEDQLTEMLAWLVDVVPQVGTALVAMAFDHDVSDGELRVTTQPGITTGRLDALLSGPSFALIIESKIDSDFDPTQIPRYLQWLGDEFADRRELRLGLMTLTCRPLTAAQRAQLTSKEGRIRGVEHLWEQLHTVLNGLVDSPGGDAIETRLVAEFLDMLGEENLIPVQAFNDSELTAWRDASKTVDRFHTFFRACLSEIGDALGAQPISASKGAAHNYIYQDFLFPESRGRIAVGLQATDEERPPGGTARRAPWAWMGFELADWRERPEWPLVADRLDEAPPGGWMPGGTRLWGVRPKVWQYLDEIVGEGTFEEQRTCFAEACAASLEWIRQAEAVAASPSGETVEGGVGVGG
jgi:hypothetical protein